MSFVSALCPLLNESVILQSKQSTCDLGVKAIIVWTLDFVNVVNYVVNLIVALYFVLDIE